MPKDQLHWIYHQMRCNIFTAFFFLNNLQNIALKSYTTNFFRLANSARLAISLAILFSNPLQFYVAISIIFPTLIAPYIRRERHLLSEYILRFSIMLFCCKYLVKKRLWYISDGLGNQFRFWDPLGKIFQNGPKIGEK